MRAPGSEAGAKRFRLVLLYLAAIIVANLLVSRYGPAVSVLNAFLFIGLDLSTRDRLHELWQGRLLWPRMLLLIGTGGLLSLLLGGSGGPFSLPASPSQARTPPPAPTPASGCTEGAVVVRAAHRRTR